MSTKRYYVSGNTADGFVHFLPSNVEKFNHVIILKHPSLTLKTKVMENIISHYENKEEVEILLSTFGKEYLDGVIIRNQSIAVIVDTIATPNLSGAIEVDLELFMGRTIEMNEEADEQMQQLIDDAYKNFQTGLTIHDDLEDIYIKEMNFERANQLAEEFTNQLLLDRPVQNKIGYIYHRLFGTNTKDGVVNVVPEIVNSITNAVYVKGRAGTGKSTFMKKIMDACFEKGYDVELYHCSFDPKSIDMVLVRDLDFCIFDSTDPHEFFPTRNSESIIDLYEEAVTPGIDEKFANEINHLNQKYKSYMKKGIEKLKQAGKQHDRIENQFHMEEKEVEKITHFILEKIVQ